MRIEVISGISLSSVTRRAIVSLCSRAFGKDLEPLFRTFREPTHVLGYYGGGSGKPRDVGDALVAAG